MKYKISKLIWEDNAYEINIKSDKEEIEKIEWMIKEIFNASKYKKWFKPIGKKR